MQGEVWKDIPGYEGLYQASNMGRVRSLPRVVDRGRWGAVDHPGGLKKPTKRRDGYYHLWLVRDGRRRDFTMHRLIARTFLSDSPHMEHVRHLNGHKWDNRAANLAYGTARENAEDQLRYCEPGQNPRGWKLTASDVREIRERLARGETNCAIRKDYGVTDVTISNIKLGRTYRWVK